MSYDDKMREGEKGEVIQAMPLTPPQALATPLTITKEIIVEMDGVATIRIVTDTAATYDISSNELRHYSIGIDIETIETISGTVRIA